MKAASNLHLVKKYGVVTDIPQPGRWMDLAASQGSGSKCFSINLSLYLQYAIRRQILQQLTTETCKSMQVGFKVNYTTPER